ncbi:MAG: DUF4331 family protein [Myxococcota bacterium]
MRAFTKWAGVTTLAFVAGDVAAADHRDGPAASQRPATDITDVYAWMSPGNERLILIMNVAEAFSSQHLYAFHLGRQTSARDALFVAPDGETTVVCRFESATNVACWVGDDYVTGDPSGIEGVVSVSGAVRVHAGAHADPFFGYLDGFLAARREALQYASVLSFDPGTSCPDASVLHPEAAQTNDLPDGSNVASALRGMLRGDYDDALVDLPGGPVDNFTSDNVWSLVLEVDPGLIRGDGPYVQVWGSTNEEGS